MELPEIGLGTWELRGPECARVVKLALELGYKHIDTAHVYQNHQEIKKALKGWDRHQLYLTSKIAVEEQVNLKKVEESVKDACEKTLHELGTDYLDLYLIHWPNGQFPLEKVFKAMEQLIREGKIRKAGVSNFNVHHLEDLRQAGYTPYANQVEFHPYLYQQELLNYCQKHHIQLISFRSFGKGKLLRDEPLFARIGEKYQKTGAQVILRWLIQKGIPAIPKASSQDHLRENIDVFDFTLTETEMRQLDGLSQNKRYCRADAPEFSY